MIVKRASTIAVITISAVVATSILVATAACDGGIQNPEITQLPRDLEPAESQLIEADNAFGVKLLRTVHAGEDPGANIFISPLSVAMALGMTYNGAAGTTRQAMQEALELHGLSVEEVNRSYRGLIDLLAGLDPAVDWRLANSIWYREDFAVRQDFLDMGVQSFDAEVTPLDFASPDAAPMINAWVSEKTGGRITDIVSAPIPDFIVMYLINAIYFKADWTVRFDQGLTAPHPFTLADGRQEQVPMMTQGEPIEVAYGQADGVEVAELPYGGKAYNMTVVLPERGADIDSLIASLDGATWRSWIDGLGAQELVVLLPRFRLEYEIELEEALAALGMEIAFDPSSADFSNMASGPGLFLSKVSHKTFVDVNEEGTEAAAATSVGAGVTSAPTSFVVDRPFLFAIRERFSGTILFLGVVHEPGS